MIVNNIKALCKREGVTVKALEEICALGNGTIRRWNKHAPTVDKVQRVASFFGVTIDELIREE